MKTNLTLLVSVLLLAACSAPKYSYYFDHYDYNSGKKKANQEKTLLAVNPSTGVIADQPVAEVASPLAITEESMVASTENTVAPTAKTVAPVTDKKILEKKYSEMTKTEKKEFRKELKTELKKYIKAKKSGDAVKDTKVMDYNLKMAIIFGAVAVTLSFFGGVNSVFWILSVVALVVGVVFFIKWLAEQ